MSITGSSLTTFGNTNPFLNWQREMNQLFERFNRDFETTQLTSGVLSPNVEMQETERSYHVEVEVPGISEKDLNISLKDNEIVIEGERKQPSLGKDAEYCTSEFSYGKLYRAIEVDDQVNANTIKAVCHNGILTIDMDKLESSQHRSRKIPILKS